MENKRESGVELLKILAMIGIVLFHLTMTLTAPTGSSNPLVINIYDNLTFSNVMYSMFMGLGDLGNIIFFTCSAYFLLDSEKVKPKKVIKMILTTFLVSISILLIFLISGVNLDGTHIGKSIFPIITNANWYITFYITFYLLHPYLNKLINILTKDQLFFLSLLLFILNYVFPGSFFPSSLFIFTSIYFLMAYFKKYTPNFMNNKKVNLILLIFANITFIVFQTILITLNEYVFDAKENNFFAYSSNCILYLFIVFPLFNLFKNMKFKNKTINKISSYTLLIYIIHENILIRQILRPMVYEYVYNSLGYDYMLLILIGLTLLTFILSLLIAYLFRLISDKPLNYLSDKIEVLTDKLLNKIKELFYKIS